LRPLVVECRSICGECVHAVGPTPDLELVTGDLDLDSNNDLFKKYKTTRKSKLCFAHLIGA
jgi:hypothetical protein